LHPFPSLQLRLIGATTLNEYREHVEKDAAFERRFQQVRRNLSMCRLASAPKLQGHCKGMGGLERRFWKLADRTPCSAVIAEGLAPSNLLK